MPEEITNQALVMQYKTLCEQGETELANGILGMILENNKRMIYNRINAITNDNRNINLQDKEDLVQESMIALMQAVKAYDETRGSFNNYAYEKIQFAILDWLEKQNRIIYIPRQKERAISQYYAIIEDFKEKNHGRAPSDGYIKKMMGVNDTTYLDIKAALIALNIISLDIKQEDTSLSFEDKIPDEKDYYFESIIQDNKDKLINIVLKLKNRSEREVLIDYFFNDIKLVDIAKKRGVTKQRVNNIKKQALEHLATLPDVQSIAKEYGIYL